MCAYIYIHINRAAIRYYNLVNEHIVPALLCVIFIVMTQCFLSVPLLSSTRIYTVIMLINADVFGLIIKSCWDLLQLFEQKLMERVQFLYVDVFN